MIRRTVWLVTDWGGEYEDSWETHVRVFATEAAARECAAKRDARARAMLDDEFDAWDHGGVIVERLEMVER